MTCRKYPLLILFTIALTLTLTHALLSPQPCQQSRPYTNHTFLGAHDAPFVGALPQQNQNLNVTAQLDLGIRFLQAQTHRNIDDPDNRLQLCHTSCLLEYAGSLEDFLRLVKGWLLVEGQGHEREVVTLLLTNGDNVDVGLFARAFKGSGVDEMVYVPETNGLQGWPSIEEIVDMGKRVVVFLDYGANTTKTPYILDEFTYFFETPFDETNASFSNCSIDRPPGAAPDNRMYLVNHFLDVDILGAKVPDRIHAPRTNAANGNGSIGAQADLCSGLYGRRPNVVLVDFVDQGEVMEAQRLLDG